MQDCLALPDRDTSPAGSDIVARRGSTAMIHCVLAAHGVDQPLGLDRYERLGILAT